MKSRSKRNRKRPRGGIGCLAGDGGGGECGGGSGGGSSSPSSLLRTEVVPLSAAFDLISGGAVAARGGASVDEARKGLDSRRVRIVRPYPFTFATFAKARWVGRTVADVYHQEFGERVDGPAFPLL